MFMYYRFYVEILEDEKWRVFVIPYGQCSAKGSQRKKYYGLQEVPVINSTLTFSKEGGEKKYVLFLSSGTKEKTFS